MKNSILLLVAALLCFALSGCTILGISPLFPTTFKHSEIPETNKKLDIAKYDISGEPFVYYTYAKQREKQLGLESIEQSGIDKSLRIWGTFSYHPRRQRGFLLEYTFNGITWSGRFYDYLIRYDEWKHFEKIEKPESLDLLPPTGGWKQFDEILHKTQFVTLPTDQRIDGLTEWLLEKKISTAATYSVEYSTPDLYRFFIFQNPQETQNEFEEPASFMCFHDYLFEIVRISQPSK